MLPLGMVITWAAYTVGSWGYVLVRGWNITLREWASPLHPYQFPGGGQNPPFVPLGRTWPTGLGKPVATDTADQGSPANPGAVA